ncbi:hypothetical protein KSZ_66250 [Dictyobacter formicarum]|uniref:Uncharacterized protein n=1 Tax=Dictyobacter formicarum TaxID=2778368 RepID=A0ABQ3VQS8_9CHLR|nr:hypothetical protein KSZ_66250 [Dictyobacter formicarum]
MQPKASFSGFLQGITPGPLRMLHACLQVEGNTRIPDQRRFLLCTTQSLVVLYRQMIQLVYFYGVHVVEYIIYGKWLTSG